ncbi:MAG TPA: serine/threonine-protein kinase [Thermoanaerobaculia bacterium]|nr:serine/threonine-protein kinase [Thermoanaerobaculia bacterium]
MDEKTLRDPGPDPRTHPGEIPRASARPIGSYKLLQELGRGGMGVVYLAARADSEYQKRVAIKVIRFGMDEPEVVRYFRRERQILASLDHPHIARLLDGGTTEDGLPYLVMEYIQGLPVDKYCDGRRLPIAERLKIFEQVCSAVAFAHRNLIVHRDLKPSNILVTPEGVPMLLDFGIAKLLHPGLSGEAPTATAVALTPEYASPEQARGESVTTASDVYSLGVILYELLAGHRPYRLKTRRSLEVLKAVCEVEPEKPSSAVSRTEEVSEGSETVRITPEEVGWARDVTPEKLRRRLSGDLDNIVLMALRKEANRRYGSVEALSEDVRRYLEGQPVSAGKGTAAYRAGKYVRRHALGVAAAAGIVLLLAGFAVTMAIQSARLARERDHVAQERDKAEKTSSFLVDLFKVSDPSEAKGNTVTAREILDKGAARIRGELKDKPQVQATLMDTMGKVYESLGLYDKAEGLLRDALQIRRRALGNAHPDVARTMNVLASVLYEKGDYAGAEALFRETLALQRRLLGSEHPDVAKTMNNLAGILGSKGDFAGAEALYRETLALQRKLLGNEHPLVAITINNLASVLDDKGDYAGAEALYRETLASERKLLGNEHPDVAQTMNYLAVVLEDEGDYVRAEALFRETLALRRKLLGNEHPDVAGTMNGLASVLEDKGDYVGAEALFRDTLALRRKLLGKEHPDVAGTMNDLAVVFEDEGDHAGAEALFRDTLALRRKLLGNEHPDVAGTMYGLAAVREDEGDYPGAEALYRETLAVRRKLLGKEHPDVARSLRGLGEVLMEEGQAKPAERLLREACEILRRALPQHHPDVAEAESALAACLIPLRQYGEAETLLVESYPILRSKRSERSSTTKKARRHLIELYEAWGKPEKAVQWRL